MSATYWDHGLAALVLVIWPVYVARQGQSGLAELGQVPGARLRQYRITMGVQWAHAAALLGLWWALGRDWDGLGLGAGGGRYAAVGYGLALVLVAVLGRQLLRLRRDPTPLAGLVADQGEVAAFLPRTAQEVRAFRALALTAGICEELVYRGFVLWYLGQWLPLPLAVLAMVLAFGAGHLYQGVTAAAQVGLVGAAAAGFYVATGALWLPMVLHALLDLHQLEVARLGLAQAPGD